MDRVFDRLADLLRTLFGSSSPQGGGAGSADPDLRDAWDELEEYLRTGTSTRRPRPQAAPGRPGRTGSASGQPHGAAAPRPGPRPDEALRPDYASLQVPFGAPLEEVKRAYKRLLQRYHPDRFADDAEKQRTAGEVTRGIIAAYRRIRQFVEKTKNR